MDKDSKVGGGLNVGGGVGRMWENSGGKWGKCNSTMK